MKKKFVCIHGHFYQPPRENAWLEEVELQDSAQPYHDWNERISAECYGPNTASRILDSKGIIHNILNNYSKISYNFGPTLLSWLEEKDPDTYQGILEADKLSMTYFGGHGSAMAQVYNHIIMPLANTRDKETQVIWGIKDFQFRFNRMPEGMWLAETAVDTESLRIMAQQGIKYTLLAPWQLGEIRRIGEEQWTIDKDSNVYNRPYKVDLGDGLSIAVFVYNGDIAQGVAFNNLLANGKHFADRLLTGFTDSDEEQLVHIATDGESYGHHHKHGDMALAYCLDYIEKGKKAELTNYGQFLEMFPPTYEARIVENTSWSCIHGVGRWKENCGCHTGGHDSWNQEWRVGLRNALNWLRDELTDIYEQYSSGLLKDPWKARNDYINTILQHDKQGVDEFLSNNAVHFIYKETETKILRLMEMQRHALLMFTSCGWFFDDIARIEGVQILQYAARAIQLGEQIHETNLEAGFLKILSTATSNVKGKGNGAHLYNTEVVPTRLNLERVGMHYSISALFDSEVLNKQMFSYRIDTVHFEKKLAGVQQLAVGTVTLSSLRTHSRRTYSFAVLHFGQHQILGNILENMDESTYQRMSKSLLNQFNEGKLGDVIGLMQSYFGPNKYTIWQLFRDEKRKVIDGIMEESMVEVEQSFRRIYNNDYQLLSALKNDSIPLPGAYHSTIKFVLNTDLIRFLRDSDNNLLEMGGLLEEFNKWQVALDDHQHFDFFAGERVYHELKKIEADIENTELSLHLNQFFELLKGFGIEPNLVKCQNLYFNMARNQVLIDDSILQDKTWREQFRILGDNLKVQMNDSVLNRKNLSHTN